MKSNWSNAAKRIMKYQFGLTLALVGSTVTVSPAQADLDEKSKVIAEWLVNFTIEILPDLTTTPQRITMPTSRASRLDTNYSGRPRGPHQRKFQR